MRVEQQLPMRFLGGMSVSTDELYCSGEGHVDGGAPIGDCIGGRVSLALVSPEFGKDSKMARGGSVGVTGGFYGEGL